MKLNKLFMLGLAGLAFTACSNDDDGAAAGSSNRLNGDVTIRLALGTAETRTLSESAADAYNNINSLSVVFYNSQGTYVEVPATVTENGQTYDNEQAITAAVAALKNGTGATHQTVLSLHGVPSSASQIYIVANQPTTGQIDTKSLSSAKNSTILLESQTAELATATDDAPAVTFTGQNSTLTGLAQITSTGNGDNITYSADVQLKPVPSRIELQNVRAIPVEDDDEWNGGEIETFTVDGFYINSFYPMGKLDVAQTAEDVRIDNGSTVDNYTKAKYSAYSYDYGSGDAARNFGFMCDEPTDGQLTYAVGGENSGVIYQATTSQWWGYQLLAGVVPHIVVKLHVKYVGETYADGNVGELKFLTIDSYNVTNEGTSTLLSGVERGKVYRIQNIDFKVNDLTDVPYEGTKTVAANVHVLAWEEVAITPNIR